MKKKRKWLALVLGALLLATGAGAEETASEAEPVAASTTGKLKNTPFPEGTSGELAVNLWDVDNDGNIILGINGKDFAGRGFEVGDILAVTVGSRKLSVPLVLRESDVKKNKYLCIMHQAEGQGLRRVYLSLRGGSLAEDLGISSSRTAKELGIQIALEEPKGYLETFLDRNLKKYDTRKKYPELTDAQYANFRMVETTGMPSGLLYRSSSPVDDAMGRCLQADAALEEAGVRTIVNLANTEKKLHSLEGYEKTNYSKKTIFARKMRSDPMNQEFRENLPDVLRFIIANQGPYLIHCKAGKDRTGFVCALLETLMGASADEVVRDYMITYYNYYGIKPEEDRYGVVAKHTIEEELMEAFGVTNLWEGQASLYEGARRYLLGCGMTDREIDALREKFI